MSDVHEVSGDTVPRGGRAPNPTRRTTRGAEQPALGACVVGFLGSRWPPKHEDGDSGSIGARPTPGSGGRQRSSRSSGQGLPRTSCRHVRLWEAPIKVTA
jgi:hypothetical protein